MQIITSKKELRNKVNEIKYNKEKISFVPTMGALHKGHLEMIKSACQREGKTFVSIFVNELQFNDKSDFESYPIKIEDDIKALEEIGVDYLFNPKGEELYGTDLSFDINVKSLGDYLCGKYRPGHFNGVCVVVLKLFNLVRPDFAFFGEKDFQQLTIIKKLIKNFDLDIELVPFATVREDSGLALSSRNMRLTEEERNIIAPNLYKILCKFKDLAAKNEKNLDDLLEVTKQEILDCGFDKVEYLEIRDSLLNISNNKEDGLRLFVAAFLGSVRLIDNIAL